MASTKYPTAAEGTVHGSEIPRDVGPLPSTGKYGGVIDANENPNLALRPLQGSMGDVGEELISSADVHIPRGIPGDVGEGETGDGKLSSPD